MEKLIPFNSGEKWGYSNEKFELIIKPEYDWADFYSSGFASVMKNGKYTYINDKNYRVLEFIYDYSFTYKEGFGVLALNDKYAVTNSEGQILIDFIFTRHPTITKEIIFGCVSSGTSYYNHRGELLFEMPKVDYSGSFFEDKAVVAVSFFIRQHARYGVINSKGEFIIEMIYDDISDFNENLAIVKKNRKYGLINRKGNSITPLHFDDIDFFSDGISSGFSENENRIVAKKNGLYGFISRDGLEVIQFKYDLATRFFDGISIVKLNEKYGAIDIYGNEVIPITYDELYTEYTYCSNLNSKVLTARKNGKSGVLNFNGDQIIEFSDCEIGIFNRHYATIKMGDKYGIINTRGKILVPPVYDFVMIDDSDLAIVKKEKYGLITLDGRMVLPCSFSHIEKVRNQDYFKVSLERDERYFYTDFSGRIYCTNLI